MNTALSEIPEISYLQLDPVQKTLLYEPLKPLPDRSLDSMGRLKDSLADNLKYCPFDDHDDLAKYCRSCRHIHRSEHVDIGARSAAQNGLIRVEKEFEISMNSANQITENLVSPAASSWRRIWEVLERYITPDKLEPIFVLVTFLAGASGMILELFDAGASVRVGSWLVAYLFGGYFGLKAGIGKLVNRTIDVDLLMILAALGAAAGRAPFEGALLLFLFSLSNVLQDFALDRTRSAIEALVRLRPTTAEVFRADDWVDVPVESVRVGEEFRLRPGGRAALDGTVVSGTSSVDESILTGESQPVEKETGSGILSGSINGSGSLRVRVTREAKDSTIARIVSMVEEARENKARTEHFLDRFEQWYTIVVIVGTIVAIFFPYVVLKEQWSVAFYRAMTIMVAASPCALVISTPAAVLSAIGNGARRGILFKGGVYVEQAAAIDTVAFDKTGTLTYGVPAVTDVVPGPTIEEIEFLRITAALENHSEHAIAHSIVAAAEKRGIDIPDAQTFNSTAGKGIEGRVEGRTFRVGTAAFIRESSATDPAGFYPQADELAGNNRTVVLVAELTDDRWRIVGMIGLSDTLRPDARAAIAGLRNHGVKHIIMLTGDNRKTAATIAAEAGVDEVLSELLPEDKLGAIEALQKKYGRIAMVGDGVNDAPALARSDIGIAMGVRGTDVAMETADIVLMGDSLMNVPYVLALSRATRRTLVFNLGLAMGLIGIMLTGIFLLELPLPLAVIGHEGGTVLVSLNGLRLLMFRRNV